MKTHEKITKKRIEKIEKELEKVRKENEKMEYTNQMYGLLNGEDMPNCRNPEDLNDLCYVINKNLKLINDGIKEKTHEEGSTSNAPQPIAGPMDSGGTSFDIGTNFERPRDPLNLVPDVTLTSMVPLKAPLMDPPNALAQLPQFMSRLRTSSQMVPLVDLSLVPSLLSSQRYPKMAYPILPTTMAYPMPSPMITPAMSNLVFPPTARQTDPLMNILSMSALVPMDNNVDGSLGIPQCPSFSELLSLNDDEIMTLLNDTSFDIYKVKLAFMENNTERRVSYRKRQKGFLTKARELNTLCNVELATLVNSPYHNEPELFPNHEAATGMFAKLTDLPGEKKS
ncbi:hypothetical protein H5410_017416 [Solanum commersonii]|uniref:MADS-box domain-containing protein n=1 Tax=Solanum commersonii TaxID=4109 RepID=A0A9J5ZZD5_SOLCO|nr:hypothetical protein H5410_017416 [Solanum commersonii]